MVIVADYPQKKRGRKPINKSNFSCHECGTTDTPEWRKGPNGRNTLCNGPLLFIFFPPPFFLFVCVPARLFTASSVWHPLV